MRRLLALVATVVVASTLLGAPAADAHAEIRTSDPAIGGTVAAGLDEITMTFISLDPTEPIEVEVLDDAGTDRVDGAVDVSARDSVVTVPVDPLEVGPHTVRWSATSSDGDGVSEGAFDFTVEEASGGGFGVWLLWIVALGIPAAVFLRPGRRRSTSR